jgi:group I intron endonuclease
MKTKTIPCKSGVYKIVNKITGNIYVGSAKLFYYRRNSHYSNLRLNKHANKHLQNAWNKYGEESFEFEIIMVCPQEYMVKLEQWFINTLKPKYNIRKEASSNIGIKFTDPSTKAKKRAVQAINWNSASYREKQTKTRSIPVLCFLYNTGEFVAEFSSGKVAAEKLKLDTSTIAKVLTRKIDSTFGYSFRYKDESLNRTKEKMISQYHIYRTGELLSTYPTLAQMAEDLQLNAWSLRRISRGKKTKGKKYRDFTIIKETKKIEY